MMGTVTATVDTQPPELRTLRCAKCGLFQNGLRFPTVGDEIISDTCYDCEDGPELVARAQVQAEKARRDERRAELEAEWASYRESIGDAGDASPVNVRPAPNWYSPVDLGVLDGFYVGGTPFR